MSDAMLMRRRRRVVVTYSPTEARRYCGVEDLFLKSVHAAGDSPRKPFLENMGATAFAWPGDCFASVADARMMWRVFPIMPG
jgi:hypothetical protein